MENLAQGPRSLQPRWLTHSAAPSPAFVLGLSPLPQGICPTSRWGGTSPIQECQDQKRTCSWKNIPGAGEAPQERPSESDRLPACSLSPSAFPSLCVVLFIFK